MTMFLSHDEIAGLTGRKRKDAQARALKFMGIEHRIRPDGSVAVLRHHVEHELGMVENKASRKEATPNWPAL